jgi:hypothetical protein
MATPTLFELMEAIEGKLDGIGLRASSTSPGAVSPPGAIVGIPPIPDYRATFHRGTVLLTDWPIYVLTSSMLDRVGQKALAEYMSWTGPNSVPLALEADPTLGGLCDDLIVTSARPLGLEEVGILNFFGGEFRLTISVSGLED